MTGVNIMTDLMNCQVNYSRYFAPGGVIFSYFFNPTHSPGEGWVFSYKTALK